MALYGYLISVLLFLISLFYDQKLVLMVTNARLSFLDPIMAWVTNPLTFITIFILMASLFLWRDKKKDWIPVLGLSLVLTFFIVSVIKFLIGRVRPFEALSLRLIEGVSYCFQAWNMSFPSFHTAAVFALVPILDKEFPKLKLFWIFAAVLIALSRVYVGVHYVSDLIAGGFIGILVGNFMVYMEEKYGFFKYEKKKKRKK